MEINNCLDNHVDFFYDELNNGSIDTCYTWGYTSHKPSYRIWYCTGVINEKNYPNVENYKLWLNFFCDYIGYDVSVYYPKKAKKSDKIKIIFIGAKITGYINWTHGELGLFGFAILPLLMLEKHDFKCL